MLQKVYYSVDQAIQLSLSKGAPLFIYYLKLKTWPFCFEVIHKRVK